MKRYKIRILIGTQHYDSVGELSYGEASVAVNELRELEKSKLPIRFGFEVYETKEGEVIRIDKSSIC